MSIAPIVKSVRVRLPPARAFAAFTGEMGRWWKPGVQIGAAPFADIVIEPRAGGRWFERDAAGVESDWGKVLAWEPPHRLLLAWQLDGRFRYDAALETEVELSFASEGAGTLVRLEHRNLERLGRDTAAQLGGGWPGLLERFAVHANSEETA